MSLGVTDRHQERCSMTVVDGGTTSLAVHVGSFVRWDQQSIPPVFYSHAQSHLILLLLRLIPLFLPSLFWHSVSPCFCYSLLPIWRSSGFEEGKGRGSFDESVVRIPFKQKDRDGIYYRIDQHLIVEDREAHPPLRFIQREWRARWHGKRSSNSSKRNGKRVRFCPTPSSIIWSCPIINSNHLGDEITDHGN